MTKRALANRWQQDKTAMWQEERILEEMSRILKEEIDHEILNLAREAHLLKQGWHRIPMSYPWSEEIQQWIDTNCRAQHERLSGRIMFECREEAVMFSMTWS